MIIPAVAAPLTLLSPLPGLRCAYTAISSTTTTTAFAAIRRPPSSSSFGSGAFVLVADVPRCSSCGCCCCCCRSWFPLVPWRHPDLQELLHDAAANEGVDGNLAWGVGAEREG